MFNFFKRNKPRPNPVSTESANKTSLNMQLAIEKQQESLQRVLEQKRKNDVNDREQKDEGSHDDVKHRKSEDRPNNRSTTSTNECDKSSDQMINACAPSTSLQNYDQFRDSKRAQYFFNDSFDSTARPGNTPINYKNQPSSSTNHLPTVVVVASSLIDDQKCSPSIISDSNSANAYTPLFDVMGKGRNRNNKYLRGNGSQQQNQHNKNVAKNHNIDNGSSEKVTANEAQSNDIRDGSDGEEIKNKSKELPVNACEAQVQQPTTTTIIPQDILANATQTAPTENSEKCDSISNENVFHDENLCSINNEQKNIDTSDVDDEAKTSSEATEIIVIVDDEKNENLVEPTAVADVENDGQHQQQQQQVPLQRTSSVKRVTFAPSPPRSTCSDSDGEDETLSEDIFYEAPEAPSDNQKLKILSTVTSHSSENRTIDEATSEIASAAIFNGERTSSYGNSNDIVCGKIILSVNENEKLTSDNKNEADKSTIVDAFTSNDTTTSSISCDFDDVPKTIKPSYLLDSIALPDIVAETSLLEQHAIPSDEMATLAGQASHATSISSNINQIEIVDQMQVKVNELCRKIDQLEQDLAVKSWNVDRLQAELDATNKEGEFVRLKLKSQDAQLEKVKEKQDVSAAEDHKKYDSLEQQYNDTLTRLQKMQNLASSLNLQLRTASVDLETLRQQRDELLDKLSGQEKLLRDILETASEDREQIAAKWKHEFEQLRNVNCDREEHLMEDCEWKLRQMMKQCKEKIEKVEKEKLSLRDQAQIDKQTIRSQRDEIKNLKACEKEATGLRGLTNDQKDSITTMTKRLEDLNSELAKVNKRLQAEIDSCEQIKRDCAYQLSEKERSALNRIEIARGEIAMEWENRLMEEMCRLKSELEQVHLDERNVALRKSKAEALLEAQSLTAKFKQREEELIDEIRSLKLELKLKQDDLREAQSKADMQLLEHRAYLERRERDHQKELQRHQSENERQLRSHSDLIDEIKEEHKREKEQIKASFYRSLEQIKEEFANEITLTTESLQSKHKKELEEQWKQLVQEKEEALQTAENRHRIRMEDADNKLRDVVTKHQRQFKDLRDQFDHEQSRLQGRDVSNSQEIDTLHRKCICLTKLFEEMRMRYERRDPRPEDLRRIDEMKSIIDSQEKDIFHLTEQLRELQLQQHQQQMQNHQNQSNNQNCNQSKKVKGRSNNNIKNTNNMNNRNANMNQNNNENIQQTKHHHQPPPLPSPLSIQQSTDNERDHQRMKIPSLIKTIIYEEENENELCEQQMREERQRAQQAAAMAVETESPKTPDLDTHHHNGFTVEHVPESPDYETKNKHIEEISEAHIISDQEIMNQPPDVVISTSADKLQEINVEVITTVEPAHIQIVNGNGNMTIDHDLD